MGLDEAVKEGAFWTFIASHLTIAATGIYEGVMHGQGKNVDLPLKYIWPANVILTGTFQALGFLVTEFIPELDTDTIIKITGSSFILAPIEFAAGYGLGYVAGKLF